MTRLAGFDIPAPPVVVLPLLVAAVLLLAGLAARGASRLSARWFSAADAPTLSMPVAAAVVIGGLLLVIPDVALPRHLGKGLAAALTVAFVLACAVVVARLAVAGVSGYASRNPSISPALGVARVATRLVIGVLAAITALQAIGVPVAPLLTTLGVGSLAVALALQETLANFFAGLYLLADRPVRAGDYIKIHDAAEGYVEAIGWRSSRLRTLANNVVIVPNLKLSQAIITNFNLPSPPVSVTVPVSVSYEADAATVERTLADELTRAATEIPDIHREDGPAKPEVRLVELGESGMLFHCSLKVRDVEAQGRASHELRKRILARLRREKIEIPFPQRVVHTAPVRR